MRRYRNFLLIWKERARAKVLRLTLVMFSRPRNVIIAMTATLLAGGALFSLVERTSLFDGLWWAVVSGYTVGYGDLYPRSFLGRLMGMFYIPFASILWATVVGHIVVAVIKDANLFSHEEQEKFEACLLAIAKRAGVVPDDHHELPPLAWWKQSTGFIDSTD